MDLAEFRSHRRGCIQSLLVACLLLLPSAAFADDKDKPHLVYLAGRIVQEQQNRRPKHDQFGYYELDQILDTFQKRGFAVSSQLRPKGQTIAASASQVIAEVHALLESGVPARRITVLGASMGSTIALVASLKLRNPELNFAVLGTCLALNVPLLVAEHGHGPIGHLLAIREKSDESVEPCPAWSDDLGTHKRLVVREIVLDTGLRHGFLYRPLPEWVDPVVEWSSLR
jgi:hypothetical protein